MWCRLRKKDKIEKFWKKKTILFMLRDLDFCYFCQGQNTRYFILQFCTMVVYTIGFLYIFFIIF
jgi:hypothetical protein